MQVRAYNYWASLLADPAYPSVEDLDLAGADFGAYSVLLDLTAGVENPGLSYIGDTLRAEPRLGQELRSSTPIRGRSVGRGAGREGVVRQGSIDEDEIIMQKKTI